MCLIKDQGLDEKVLQICLQKLFNNISGSKLLIDKFLVCGCRFDFMKFFARCLKETSSKLGNDDVWMDRACWD